MPLSSVDSTLNPGAVGVGSGPVGTAGAPGVVDSVHVSGSFQMGHGRCCPRLSLVAKLGFGSLGPEGLVTDVQSSSFLGAQQLLEAVRAGPCAAC